MTDSVNTRTCAAFVLTSLALLGLSACGSNGASSISATATTPSPLASASASMQNSATALAQARAQSSARTSATTLVQSTATTTANPSIAQPTASATVSEGSVTNLVSGSEQYQQNQSLVQSLAAAVQNVTLAPLPSASSTGSEGTQSSSSADIVQAKLSDESTQKILALATGSAAEDFQTQAIEYAQKGWVVTGQPTFTGTPKISETTYQGSPAQKLAVCMDISQVSVKNKAGQNMLPAGAPQHAMTYYTLVQEAGVWKIASLNFPDNPDC